MRRINEAFAIALALLALGGGTTALATSGNSGCIDISSLVCYMFGLCDGGYYEYCDVSAPNPGASGLPWIITMPAPGPVPSEPVDVSNPPGGPTPVDPTVEAKKALILTDAKTLKDKFASDSKCEEATSTKEWNSEDTLKSLEDRGRLLYGGSSVFSFGGGTWDTCTKPGVGAFSLTGAGVNSIIVFCDEYFKLSDGLRQTSFAHEMAHVTGHGHKQGPNPCFNKFLNVQFSNEIAKKCDLPRFDIPDFSRCL